MRDINLYAIWDVSYHVIRGQDQTWLIGEERPLRFAADGEYSLFQGVTVDKKQLNPTVDYESAAGSTIVDLKAEYLRTLGQGRHSLRFDYIDGQTNTVSFYIKKDVPSTGDDARFGLWIVLTVISAVGLVIVHRKRRHRDEA